MEQYIKRKNIVCAYQNYCCNAIIFEATPNYYDLPFTKTINYLKCAMRFHQQFITTRRHYKTKSRKTVRIFSKTLRTDDDDTFAVQVTEDELLLALNKTKKKQWVLISYHLYYVEETRATWHYTIVT